MLRYRSSCAVLMAGLAACVIGCEAVETTVFIGERLEDAPQWNGVWMVEDDVVHLHAGTDGVVHAAVVEWADDSFKMTEFPLVITRLDDQLYMHIPVTAFDEGEPGDAQLPAETGPTRYSMLHVEQLAADELKISIANAEVFRIAVEKARLKGTVERKANGKPERTTISDKQALDEFIRSGSKEQLFPEDASVKVLRLRQAKQQRLDSNE